MPGRNNGRHADSYAPLVDLDPQLADAVLSVLADVSIAAYAVPVSDHRSLMQLPARHVDRPLDRVYVDSAARGEARTVVEAHLPQLVAELESGQAPSSSDRPAPAQPPEGAPGSSSGSPSGASSSGFSSGRRDLDEDAAWAAIVAGYDTTPTDTFPRWPVAEELSDEPVRRQGDGTTDDDEALHEEDDDGRAGDELAAPADRPASPQPAPRDPEEHFVPPPPPPLRLPSDPIDRAAWAGVIGGPLLFLLSTLVSWYLPDWLLVVALVAFVGGFVTLVARMKDRPPPDSGYDDGAVV